MLLLHTRGARSGQPRSTPLLYTRHGRGYVVVASKAGADHHPAWYYNMRAHPGAVTIEVGGRHIPVRPREAEGPEREELWRLANDNYNGYQVYQQRGGPADYPGRAARASVTAAGPRVLADLQPAERPVFQRPEAAITWRVRDIPRRGRSDGCRAWWHQTIGYPVSGSAS
jgi:deazaflavin-dependent oxidoreductase (nitroreductase family)